MGSTSRYVWRIPQGYVGVKFTPYCIRVTYEGELLYFDRNLGQTVSEEEIIQSIASLNEVEQLALQQFLKRYPTKEDKMLFWCRGIQHTARTYLKKLAKELEQIILSKRLKEVNGDNSTQKGVMPDGIIQGMVTFRERRHRC
jgi:hypothetical protein